MNSPLASANDVFLNVRKAYRLLHDYQQMVINAVRYIVRQLDMPEFGGEAKFAGDASAGYRYLEKNASWDWLPMIGWCFHCVRPLGKDDWVSLSFVIISDTGFFEADPAIDDKTEIAAFAPADLSSTKFGFLLRRGHVNPFPLSFDDKEQVKQFINGSGGIANGVVGKCYDMSSLLDEADANQVVSDIVEAAKSSGFPLH